jgi:methionyl-tRNA formyltransferase
LSERARAIVFANHDVGVRCLSVLLAAGVDIPLVVTHADDPGESLAFASVAQMAFARGLNVAFPNSADEPEFIERIVALAPDFIFSFYYRQLLGPAVLQAAKRGALNMHGSLLPSYRGRAPVNWAVIRGETHTGATLHYMTEKADAGDIVDQQAVPILPDDTAFQVFSKITVAAEIVLWRTMPALIAGSAPRKTQDAAAGSYFGRRRPEDGRIDWNADAKTIHDLVRGVAPPYPGAYTMIGRRKLRVLRTMRQSEREPRWSRPTLYVENGACFVDCADGGVLRIVDADLDGQPIAPVAIVATLGTGVCLPLNERGTQEVAG